MAISDLAVVDSRAQIGANVTIDPYAIVQENVSIGKDSHIHAHASVMSGTVVGDRTEIFQGAILGSIPQDLKYKGEQTKLIIGSDVKIREYCTINKGTAASGETKINNHALIMAYVHVAHDCIVGSNAILANNVNLAGHVQVDDYAIIGGMTAVQQFVRIGESSFIGGGTLVRKDVPPYIKVAREPLSYVGINSIGLRRRDFPDNTINEIKDLYRMLFVKNQSISRAIQEIKLELPESRFKDEILSFIQNSGQGLVRGLNRNNKA